MSASRGLVDLAEAIATPEGTLYRAVEEPGHYIHVPAGLEVAAREDGSRDPDLSLELVRGESPFLPPAPYGVLQLRVAPPAASAAVLEAARTVDPQAFVTPAIFADGHLRLQVIAGGDTLDDTMAAEIERPVWLASNGLDSARMVRRLTPDAALLLRGALSGGTLTVSAVAEMTVLGLTERLAVTVAFERRALLDALTAASDEQARLSVDAIVALWTREDGVALQTATGVEQVARARLARVLADWTVASFATPVASAGPDVLATVMLRPQETLDGALKWDLSRGRTTRRRVVLRLDPFSAASRIVAAGGIDRFWHETVVPPLETGVVHIDVDTNLPHPINGIARSGVQLRVPPHPPERMHELSAALLFDEAQEPQRVEWRMSPREPLQYEYSCFTLLRTGTTTRRLDAAAMAADSRRLLIGADDMPVDLVSIGATDALLREAAVHGACTREAATAGGATQRVEFALSATQPRVAIAVEPGTAEQFAVSVEACPIGGGDCIALGPLPARSIKLDVTSFAQFGSQVIDVAVDFDIDVPLVALELLAERDVEDPARATVLWLTPAAPVGQWRYVNLSPFRSGYRFRGRGDQGAWSDVRPAGSALRVAASQLVENAGTPPVSPTPPVAGPEGFRFEDLYCYPGEEPDTHLVVPLLPGPELTSDGRPVLMTLPAGDGGFLQLGIHLGPSGASLERLRAEVARRTGAEPEQVRLQVAPIEVDAAALLVAEPDGPEQELARSTTSNFPPFNVAFSVPLTSAQLAAAMAAGMGQTGRLLARFHARVLRPLTVSASARGDIAAVLARVRAATGDREDVARAAIEEAVLTGELRIELAGPADALSMGDGELLEHGRARVLELLRDLVLRLSRVAAAPPDQAPTALDLSFSEPSWLPLTPTIDIASWFAPDAALRPTAT